MIWIILKFNNKEEIIEYKVTNEDTKEILQFVCENSIYAYQNEIYVFNTCTKLPY